MSERTRHHAFRSVPRTGVIYVMAEAAKRGYSASAAGWSNLGQGQPESGPLSGAPERIEAVPIDVEDQEYSPVAGIWEMRAAVADLYNQLYRRGLPSQYSAENVAISGGGRSALTRAAAALGTINLGHFLPDYTAYEELLDIFRAFTAIPILLDADRGYEFTPSELRREILGRGLSAILLSNPCNPTGKLVHGDELAHWVEIARSLDCSLLLDEFYSHYIWRQTGEATPMVSAARYVEDVDRDPVVIFDGLTKNWRYPGWRISWTLGPKAVIDAISSAGSFLDGGASRPLQRAALQLLTPEHTRRESAALQATFAKKRELMIRRARGMGMGIDLEPAGTFYVWASVADLPEALASGDRFFRAALDRQVICVPGEFFDIDPGSRRATRPSRFRRHVRLSFGPDYETLTRGLDRLEAMLERAR